MAFSPFEGGRGDEPFQQHPKTFIPLTPFKGGKSVVILCNGVKEYHPLPEKGFDIASNIPSFLNHTSYLVPRTSYIVRVLC